MTTQYFTTDDARRLAWRRVSPAAGRPVLVWLSGFRSDMDGTKAKALEDWARRTGHGAILFDYSGHGSSGGRFEDGTISDWRADTLAVLDRLAGKDDRLILVGSSMGGWIALLAALARPERVSGLVLIAPAADFTETLMWQAFTEDQKAEILDQGFTMRPSDYGDPYRIGRALIEDGRKWLLMDAPVAFDGPVRILQGMQDPDVPWEHALRLGQILTAEDVVVTLVKDGDHRLSRPQDIARLLACCSEVADRVSP